MTTSNTPQVAVKNRKEMNSEQAKEILFNCIEKDKTQDALIRARFNRHRNTSPHHMRWLRRINRKTRKSRII